MKKNSTTRHRRLLMLVLAVAMLASLLAGCNFGSKDPTDPEPSDINPGSNVTDEPTNPSTQPPTDAPTDPEPTEKPVMGTVIANNLNVRSNASTDSTVLKQLAINSRVEILSQKTVGDITWGRIAEGWVNMHYVKIDGEEGNTPETTKPNETTKPTETTKPNETTKPTTSDKDTDTDTPTTTTSFNGTVTTDGLNIRKGPGTSYGIDGSYSIGTRVKILEKSGNWGRTAKGWISLSYVHKDGTTGKNTGVGYITASELNIRTGPSADTASKGVYKYGTRIKILEKLTIDDKVWAATDKGWVSLKYVYVEGEKGDGAGSGTITGDALNIRSGPGTSYKSVGHLNKDDKVEILAQLKIGETTWGYIGGKTKGWISMSYVLFDGEGSSGSGSSGTGTAGTTSYAISIASTTNGTVKASASSAKQGTTITLTISPKSGYALDTLTVKDAGGNSISVTDGKFSMPASKVTITATFKTAAKTYTVTVNKPTGGTVTANYTTCAAGTTVALTVKPNTGYKLEKVTAMNTTANEAVTVTNETFTMPEGNVNVVATFVETTDTMYSITVSYGANGKVLANTTSAAENNEVKLTILPNSGYELASLVVKDAGNVEIPVSGDKFTMPGSNVTVYATFRAKTYTATAGACVNGSVSINPDSFAKGATVTPTITPSKGYKLKDLIVTTASGDLVTATNGKFLMPAENVTVTATFEKADYTITVASVTNGTVTADVKTAQYGNTVNLTITPKVGYEVEKLVIKNTTSGTNVLDVANGVDNFEMPAGNVTITVTFKQADYTITGFSSADGTVTASATAKYGATVTLTVTPATGKVLDKLEVKDSLGREVAVTSNKFVMPAYHVTITATFKDAT